MSNHPKVGAYVLESLTTGMYTEPLDAVREYIQNAMDSILLAERDGLLSELNGRIDISVSKTARQFSVRDNGVGVGVSEVYSRLLNIGMSGKELGKNAGFRGIGRLAGIAYCKQLIFRTSAPDEDRASEVVVDCEKLRGSLAPSNRQVEELADVLARHTTVTDRKGSKAEHFFEVVLEGILPEGDEFLNGSKLETYLCQVAPVPFDATKFLFAPKITKWLKTHGLGLPQCGLYITEGSANNRQVLKEYKQRYKVNGPGGQDVTIPIEDVEIFCDDDSKPTYWGWYAKAPTLGTVTDDAIAGLRLRHHNIALGLTDPIGDIFASVSDSGQYRRFNRYYIGEVHVLSDGVIPNARRDNFEDNPAWQAIRPKLAEVAQSLIKLAYDASKVRNTSPEVLVQKASRTIEDVSDTLERGLASKDQQQSLVKRVDDDLKKIQRVAESIDDKSAKALKTKMAELSGLKGKLEAGNNFATDKLPTSLSRKEKAMIRHALGIMHRTLSTSGCSKWESCYNAMHEAIINELTPGKKD
jgi:molecular chaperone HtpG